VRTLALAWNDAHVALHEQRVDAAVARLPFPTGALHVTLLYDEPRVLLVPVGHRLAGRSPSPSTTSPTSRCPGARPGLERLLAVDPRPDGRRAPDGPFVAGLEDKLELIAAGQAVAIMPAIGPGDDLRRI